MVLSKNAVHFCVVIFFTVMCPKGDDPVTINQDYRTISVYVTTQTPAYTYPSGKLGLELYGKVAFIDLALPEKCSEDLSFSGPFGEVACSYVRSGDYGSYLTFELTFLSWPSTSMDTNMYYNIGNPSLYDFHCDISRVAFIRITECKFTDIYATNVMGESYVHLLAILILCGNCETLTLIFNT